jgi:hypothetical protein
MLLGEWSEKHTSGAKAQFLLLALSARLKSCPDASCLLDSHFPQRVMPRSFVVSLGSIEVVP